MSIYKIYLISAEINEKILYKIGYTKREVHQRVKDFKTGNASNFDIISIFESRWGSILESILKRRFSNLRIRGEWFDLHSEDVSKFQNTCKLLHENLEMLYSENEYFFNSMKNRNI